MKNRNIRSCNPRAGAGLWGRLTGICRPLALVPLALLLLNGCASMQGRGTDAHPVQLDRASDLLPEASLIDVWIEVFEPGPLPKEGDEENRDITAEIRKVESRFIPVHLKDTLQKTGYWGAVRVVPKAASGGELLVKGRILESDGAHLKLHIQAMDSRGEQWLEKDYQETVGSKDYQGTVRGEQDAFQNLYNRIANDLIHHWQALSPQDLQAIRRVAELRFATDMAPNAFQGYLDSSEGHYRLRRLPAEQDPMAQRIRGIRGRDALLIDTVNDYYDSLYRDLWEPYDNWRKFRTEEAENLRKVKNEALARKILGIGAVIGAIALEAAGGRSAHASTSTLRGVMLIGGALVAKSGFDMDSEKQIHIDAMQELGVSFESEASPLVVEVDGETHQLTGSAEVQYAKWRTLLHSIHATETALPDPVD